MNRDLLQQWLDTIELLVPDPETDFGPAYGYIKKQQKLAIKTLRAELRKPEYQPYVPKCSCCGTFTPDVHALQILINARTKK